MIYWIFHPQLNKERNYSPMAHVIAGGAAGAGMTIKSLFSIWKLSNVKNNLFPQLPLHLPLR